MGRKKKAKKIIKEALKKDKKKTKQAPKKEEKIIKPKKKFPFKKIFSVLSFLFFSSITAFLLVASFSPREISRYFNENEIVLSLEISSDLKNIRTKNALKALSLDNVEKFFGEDFQDVLGRSLGLVLIRNENLTLSPIYFFEAKSVKKTFEHFKINDEQSQIIKLKTNLFPEIKMLENAKYLTVIDSYFFFSNDNSSLLSLLKMQNNEQKKLFYSEDFKNIYSKMPQNKLAFLFVNSKKIVSMDISDDTFPKELFLSLTKIFPSQGISLHEENGEFLLSSYSNSTFDFSQIEGRGEKILSFPKAQKSLIFLGISNPKNILEKFVSQIDEDTQKLLTNDFAISFSEESLNIMISGLDEKEEKMVEEQIFSFVQGLVGYEKDTREITLPDGNTYLEYYKIPKQIISNQKYHSGVKYFDFSGEIFFLMNNGLGIISNNENSLKEIIDSSSNISFEDNILVLNLKEVLGKELLPFSEIEVKNKFEAKGVYSKSKLILK